MRGLNVQTLTQIRELLSKAGLTPNKAFGQSFLIDQNLMGKLLELAELTGDQTVLEVGPGTGSLTEELLARCRKVVAVEIDRGLAGLLAGRFAAYSNFRLVQGDVLASKRTIAPAVIKELGAQANLVSNLPYNIATPLVVECLIDSWRSKAGSGNTDYTDSEDSDEGESRMGRQDTGSQPSSHNPDNPCNPCSPSPVIGLCRFNRLTFTVQREVADRLKAEPGSGAYGPVSIIVALLGKAVLGPPVPPTAFWPRPNVASRIVRIDFDPVAARALADVDVLGQFLSAAFAQRRKQIGSLTHRKGLPFAQDSLTAALRDARIDPGLRAQDITPHAFLAATNSLTRSIRSA
ncbi:MAG: rRNA adenine dimethyltransferase family protein [Phycisphaerae bacterium]